MKLIFCLLISLSLLMTAGCGKKDDKTSSSNEDKKEQTDSKKKPDEKVDFKSGDLGISSGLPDSYPKDIPEIKDAKVLGYITTNEGTIVTFESNGNFKDITTKFKDDMKNAGYDQSKDGGEIQFTEKLVMLIYKKGNTEVSFTATQGEDGKSSYMVTYK